jgi:hypothetical protein
LCELWVSLARHGCAVCLKPEQEGTQKNNIYIIERIAQDHLFT